MSNIAKVERDLADDWRKCGITEGDTALIHSSARRTLGRIKNAGVHPSVDIILRSFLAAIGQDGTLLFPLFNFDFTTGIPFDIRTSPSKMGALTEVARLYPGAVRTGHPIYSFAAIGKRATEFEGVANFSGYGHDSPFAILCKMNGKIASLDLSDQHSMTFYHHVEEMCGVQYRYHKKFTGPYTDAAGLTESRTFGLFVRNIAEGVKTHVDPMGEELWRIGLYSGYRPNDGAGLRVVRARGLFDATQSVIKSGRSLGMLYRKETDNE
ncbi:AAC(3) family N-acetyltransferase [Mesorhizobium sp. M2D.F.Ca.ET.233.01.1.1]|uniref:AAC(3) family N-acetyltransferase n=1 Tax=Mesorhizobium sp. M2D.F.Ca.ET.233.01.1.1 TaxID=2563943 RepID=UPI00109354D1|nr:AAC(3) family N-acetyltransferase [Mesorhizobium sp. M2D.F.Ca.ET.233.01.1.1]TGP14677.1 AAC(3) family N-acetyltransferase [Mesorhizobium sp. M2D.F.Ca.ET.233.01.1.1]TGV66875.1 AAC(3) family N-acetyltransferase [Mesorhizobium sp. M2D.F.Ca.ET.160.01.1.1]